MLNISIDSCADLSQHLIDAHRLRMISLHVLVNGKDHHDNDLTLFQLFSNVEKTGELPKTAAPSVNEFTDFFDMSEQNIYIGLSSHLSATMQNASLAAKQLEKTNLFLIDSLNLSTGIGLLALKAADLRDAGHSALEIKEEIEKARQLVRTAFVIDTMEYLHKGGRCTGLQAFVGSMLQIRPVIHVLPNGKLGVLEKLRGSRKKALDALIDRFKSDLPEIDLTRVFVTHTGCDEDADYLVNQLQGLAPIENVYITLAGATIASHCGPDTIGVLYLKL
ncbi:MAG: DegV family protein [Brevefilum sp.]